MGERIIRFAILLREGKKTVTRKKKRFTVNLFIQRKKSKFKYEL